MLRGSFSFPCGRLTLFNRSRLSTLLSNLLIRRFSSRSFPIRLSLLGLFPSLACNQSVTIKTISMTTRTASRKTFSMHQTRTHFRHRMKQSLKLNKNKRLPPGSFSLSRALSPSTRLITDDMAVLPLSLSLPRTYSPILLFPRESPSVVC